MHDVTMYTDGACSGNPGRGGWGVVLTCRDATRELSGWVRDATNNRMELRAVLQGLDALTAPCRVTVVTDSRNVVGWLSEGWKRKNPVIAALCREIEDVTRQKGLTVTYEWVRGHSGHPLNERADQLATEAIYTSDVDREPTYLAPVRV